MVKVGLTGGIGSGKSVVAQIFKVLGIPVFDADFEAKQLMQNDDTLKNLLVNEFGEATYIDGQLNRSYLADIVFNDPAKLKKLNALVHPITIAAAEAWMLQQSTPYLIKEAALLFEAGSAGHLDYVIGVFAPEHIRLQRVIERDKLSVNEVKSRIARQMQDDIKMNLCNFILTNDEQQLLIPQVLELH